MLKGLFIGTNIFIASCYLTIAVLIYLGLKRGQQHILNNPLGLATVAIFSSSALGHAAHVLAVTLVGEEYTSGSTLGIQAGVDLLAAIVAGTYFALRRQYSIAQGGPLLLAKTRNQLESANAELARINANLESLVEARTSELWQTNQKLTTEIASGVSMASELQRQNRLAHVVAEIAIKIRQSLQLEEILQTTVNEVREFLQTERVIIYRLYPDGWGTVVTESVADGWPIILEESISDRCFPDSYIQRYREGRILAIPDLEKSNLNSCHVEMLQKFGVKANLVVPILQGEELWGLLIAHHCASPRAWDTPECELLKQLADQVGIALAQAQFLEALRQSEIKYRSVVDNVKEVIFQTDATGLWTFLNPAWREITGFSVEESIGRSFLDYVHPSDRQRNLDLFQTLIQGKKEYYRGEIRYLTKDGDGVWLDVHAQLTLAADNKIVGTSGTLNDITHRVRADEEIRKALEKEKELNSLKSGFISMTSHEFRTPLSTILSSSELLEHYSYKWTEEKKLLHTRRIQASVKRMTQLLNDVLLIGIAEAGKLQFNPEPLELSQLCRDLVEELQQSNGKQHAISFVEHSDLHPCLPCLDEKLLRHILYNLLSNALKYSPAESKVHFELACQEEEVMFKIEDSGIGIPPEDQIHLFDSFHRARNVGTIPGTGLGLAIVKKCVDLHGGQIAVKSEVGVGTKFTVTLPTQPNKSNHNRL